MNLTHCPYCHQLLIDEYNAYEYNAYAKSCNQLDHNFHLKFFNNLIEISIWFVHNNNLFNIRWQYPTLKTILFTPNLKEIHLPFFEPNLENYSELLQKIKNLLIFL